MTATDVPNLRNIGGDYNVGVEVRMDVDIEDNNAQPGNMMHEEFFG